MKIAIIGGSGFVGTKLITELQKSAENTVLNIDKAQSASFPSITQIGNVADLEGLTAALAGADTVVLLAAEHRDDVTPVSLYYDINVGGMENTLKAMEANGIKHLLFTSSVAVYGLDKDNPDETHPVDPFNHYGKSKWQAEEKLQAWQRSHADWTLQVIRPTVIFGEDNRGNVFNLLAQIASGKFMMIGKGTNEKSMSYVRNIVAFMQFLIERPVPGLHVYNYSDKPDLTTNDLVAATSKIMNKSIPTVRIPYFLGILGGYGFDVLAFVTRKKLNISSVRVKKFCAVTKFDASKAFASGFVPPYTMEEGLRRMMEQEFLKK